MLDSSWIGEIIQHTQNKQKQYIIIIINSVLLLIIRNAVFFPSQKSQTMQTKVHEMSLVPDGIAHGLPIQAACLVEADDPCCMLRWSCRPTLHALSKLQIYVACLTEAANPYCMPCRSCRSMLHVLLKLQIHVACLVEAANPRCMSHGSRAQTWTWLWEWEAVPRSEGPGKGAGSQANWTLSTICRLAFIALTYASQVYSGPGNSQMLFTC